MNQRPKIPLTHGPSLVRKRRLIALILRLNFHKGVVSGRLVTAARDEHAALIDLLGVLDVIKGEHGCGRHYHWRLGDHGVLIEELKKEIIRNE